MAGNRVTLRDIAKRLSLSMPTVSRALADHPDISSATKERVRDVAQALRDVEADVLVICTDVEGVFESYGTPEQRLLKRMTPAEARHGLEDRSFPPGSMGPKVEAAASFAESGARRAVICALDDAPEAVRGHAGTTISAG